MPDPISGSGPRITTTPSSTTTPTRPAAPKTPATPAAPQAWAPKSNDKVLFVAMNNSDAHRSTLESDALKARGTNVTVLQDLKVNDSITTTSGGVSKTHDLATPEGAMSFALTLGLPGEQTKKVATAIQAGGTDARDELAQIAQQWAVAERGGQAPSRLILSGHHVGYGVYGENNGKLDWPTVGALAEAMPKGARSVEDLMIAGCYSGGENMMEKYTGMFPAAKTIVAYTGSSPGASSGATAHQKAWERATRGTSESLDRKMFEGMRKGENVSVWTRTKGFDDGSPRAPIADLKAAREELKSSFTAAWDGSASVGDPQSGPVRQYYSATQRLIQHPETTPAERKDLEAQRDQTIRLIFYGPVSTRFQEVYGPKLDAGFKALGLPVPNFKTMSRAEGLSAIKGFQDKLAATPGAGEAARKLGPVLKDFSELKPSLIPDTWV